MKPAGCSIIVFLFLVCCAGPGIETGTRAEELHYAFELNGNLVGYMDVKIARDKALAPFVVEPFDTASPQPTSENHRQHWNLITRTRYRRSAWTFLQARDRAVRASPSIAGQL